MSDTETPRWVWCGAALGVEAPALMIMLTPMPIATPAALSAINLNRLPIDVVGRPRLRCSLTIDKLRAPRTELVKPTSVGVRVGRSASRTGSYEVIMGAMVMVVEDEPNIGTLVRTYLRRVGYDALWVRSSEEALTELRRHPIELVVLDIGLPGIDGFEVWRRIGGQTPVIMLTARMRNRTWLPAWRSGPTTTSPSPAPHAN